MTKVTVSPKFQVVIPKDIRDRLKLRPSQKMTVFLFEDRIELIPVRPLSQMRGFLRGPTPTSLETGSRVKKDFEGIEGVRYFPKVR